MIAERAAPRLLAEDHELLQLQVAAAQRMRETVDALLELARSTLQPMPLEAVALGARRTRWRTSCPRCRGMRRCAGTSSWTCASTPTRPH